MARLGGGGSQQQANGGPGGKKGGKEGEVVELTDANFEERVLRSKELWLVEFFAPWYNCLYII
jgi:protein disulfide-isomerase A6